MITAPAAPLARVGASQSDRRSTPPGRACDHALDLALVAFAAWTVVYHACVLARAPAWAAAALWAAAFAAAAWWLRGQAGRAAQAEPAAAPAGVAGRGSAPAAAARPRLAWPPRLSPSSRRPVVWPPAAAARPRLVWPPRLSPSSRRPVVVAGGLAALAGAGLFAFTGAPFGLVWVLWLLAAAAGLVAGVRAARGRPGPAWLERAVVAGWAAGLAGLSLVLNGPDADDAYYVHLSSWIGVHGAFPVRDVLFAGQRFPAIYFPPVSAYEALVGTVANLTPLPAPAVVYYLVPPVAAALAVLALWRLLRAWEVRPAALALSVALLFLVLDAAGPRMFGAFFVGRIWQGKVLFLCIGVPLLLAVLQERRSLALIAAAGTAGVGLTTTAMFVVPVIAAGAVLAAGRRALPAFAAASAYPLAAGLATLALHGRTPDHYTTADVVPSALAHYVLGTGGLALLGLGAALAGPLVLPRRSAGALAAGAVLAVALLLAPGVPALVLHTTGLGRVLWRLLWAVPAAALLGALAVRRRLALPIVAVLALAGHPMWRLSGGPRRAHAIAYKQPPGALRDARRILRATGPGDVVLAPEAVSQTIAALSGAVYTVDARGFYTDALPPAAAAPRRLLAGFAANGLYHVAPDAVRHALAGVDVAVACVPAAYGGAQRLLRADGYVPAVRTAGLACLRRR